MRGVLFHIGDHATTTNFRAYLWLHEIGSELSSIQIYRNARHTIPIPAYELATYFPNNKHHFMRSQYHKDVTIILFVTMCWKICSQHCLYYIEQLLYEYISSDRMSHTGIILNHISRDLHHSSRETATIRCLMTTWALYDTHCLQ